MSFKYDTLDRVIYKPTGHTGTVRRYVDDELAYVEFDDGTNSYEAHDDLDLIEAHCSVCEADVAKRDGAWVHVGPACQPAGPHAPVPAYGPDAPAAPHGCGICDAPLVLDHVDRHGHRWYECSDPDCDNGHCSIDCCEAVA